MPSLGEAPELIAGGLADPSSCCSAVSTGRNLVSLPCQLTAIPGASCSVCVASAVCFPPRFHERGGHPDVQRPDGGNSEHAAVCVLEVV